jgi:hypothetical protein
MVQTSRNLASAEVFFEVRDGEADDFQVGFFVVAIETVTNVSESQVLQQSGHGRPLGAPNQNTHAADRNDEGAHTLKRNENKTRDADGPSAPKAGVDAITNV